MASPRMGRMGRSLVLCALICGAMAAGASAKGARRARVRGAFVEVRDGDLPVLRALQAQSRPLIHALGVGGVNPGLWNANGTLNQDRSVNCLWTALATDLTRGGSPTVAPAGEPSGPDIFARYLSVYGDRTQALFRLIEARRGGMSGLLRGRRLGLRFEHTQDSILGQILQGGQGARGIVLLAPEHGKIVAHALNIENIGGVVHWIDGQSSIVYTGPLEVDPGERMGFLLTHPRPPSEVAAAATRAW